MVRGGEAAVEALQQAVDGLLPEMDFLQSWRDDAAAHEERLAVAQAATAAAEARYRSLGKLMAEMTQLRAGLAVELKGLLDDITAARAERAELNAAIADRRQQLADLLEEIERTVTARRAMLSKGTQ